MSMYLHLYLQFAINVYSIEYLKIKKHDVKYYLGNINRFANFKIVYYNPKTFSFDILSISYPFIIFLWYKSTNIWTCNKHLSEHIKNISTKLHSWTRWWDKYCVKNF